MSAAQVWDWLSEKYNVDATDRTVRRFVAGLRERYGIKKKEALRREYEAVDELPMGFQMQMDFGVKSYVTPTAAGIQNYTWRRFP